MLDGVSECWLLSASCTVNWSAWSAIGTGLAVVIAIFGPALHRAMIRKKANSLFALAYFSRLLAVSVKMETLEAEFPVGKDDEASRAAEQRIMGSKDEEERFEVLGARLPFQSDRTLDLSKWPGVDMGVASEVAMALDAVADLAETFRAVGVGQSTSEVWDTYFKTCRFRLDQTSAALERAISETRFWVGEMDKRRARRESRGPLVKALEKQVRAAAHIASKITFGIHW